MVAMRERRPVWHGDVDEAVLAAHTLDDEHRALLRQLAIRSFVAVPMVARGRTIGALSLVVAAPRRYAASDVLVAEELASRAAIAIDNARLFTQMETARHEAEDANRAKDEFLAMLGHELRNPLAPIVDRARSSCAQARRPRRSVSASDVIERQVEHLVRLVDDLLDVSRIVHGKIELTRAHRGRRRRHARGGDGEPASGEPAAPADARRGARLVGRRRPSEIGAGDRKSVDQRCALHRSGRRDPPIARREQNQASVHVIDNGRGIDRDMLERVFDRFRARQPDHRSRRGRARARADAGALAHASPLGDDRGAERGPRAGVASRGASAARGHSARGRGGPPRSRARAAEAAGVGRRRQCRRRYVDRRAAQVARP